MRIAPIRSLTVALLAALATGPAVANMYKCTAADGTVLYQARPCGAGQKEAPVTSAGAADAAASTRTSPTRDAQERAVMERDLAQRRARCVSYRETIEKQKPLLDSPNDVTRQHAANEMKNQEKRMRDDACATN